VRELLSWRLVAALAALAGLAFLASSVLADDDQLAAIVDPAPQERRVDLISPVIAPLPSEDFEIDDGLTVGYLDLLLPGERTMRVAPGTPGEISCDEFEDFYGCGVFADVLGDAVVWFALVPATSDATAELPPIIDLDEGYAVLENGWRIAYPPVIERDCGDVDIPSFSDFLEDHGPDSVSIVDLNLQQVTRVRCGDVDPTATTVPASSGPPSTVIPSESSLVPSLQEG
jgi:hypothetical protein